MVNGDKNQKTKETEISEERKKKCFVIMPISDNPNYESGHFTRVYNHLIKPACEKAGFESIRADESQTTNLIALDIIKLIVDCDMAICDVSSKNPNVLYELGIRQAFNLPVTIIRDGKTDRIFDIQSLRDVTYDEVLRIDRVEIQIEDIAKTLKNTYEGKDKEVNSLVSLLGIEPAKKGETIKISAESSIILNEIKSLGIRISKIERNRLETKLNDDFPMEDRVSELMRLARKDVGEVVYGRLMNDDEDRIFIKLKDGREGVYDGLLRKFYITGFKE